MKPHVVLVALTACWHGGTAPPSPPPAKHAVALADRTCKQPHEDMLRTFVTSAADQLGGVADQLHIDPPEPPDPDDPDAAAQPAGIDPRQLIHFDRAEAFEDVLVVDVQVGYDGLYAVGVAGVFVGCTYVPIAKTVATPIDDEHDVLRPDALVKLGWLTADPARKAQLARDFVVGVLLDIASPQLAATDDFGATFTDDQHATVHTPPFAPPTAHVAGDGSAVVDVWLPTPGNMGSEPDDPNTFRLYHYAVHPNGAVTVASDTTFSGDRPSRKKPKS